MLLQRDAFTKYFPLPLRTIKLARERIERPTSTTSYYKACAKLKYFPVLLRTTKLAQGKEGVRGQPVLLRTTNLVES